ncbi:MAG: Asp-tRNA(Asn)/Glu-tRNA(Gln) amidotransferase subunit GatC [Phycisphaerae bacterium]|jgi:aspartyl-tRNA(Asn)/glutamyl-tRNA(Gln) amidotransferase subunit C
MAKTIDLDLVRHIGKLSRIELTEQEVQTFSRQLAGILDYFDKLRELDTSNVQPMAHAVEIHNVLAADTPGESLTPDQALANAPQRDGNFFKVPKVIGDSQ